MGYTEKISNILTKDVIFLLDSIEAHGFEARIVGGAVRNMLLGVDISDIDIATSATPDKVTEIFREQNITVIPTGFDHGTVTIILNKKPYEITTLRKDVKTFGRKAEVSFCDSFKIDSERRDFTINALYMDKCGKIFDYHNGLQDIKEKKIKFIGNPEQRIKEDFLRIFRYFRFVAYYGDFKCNEDYLKIIFEMKDKISLLSSERILNEMLKICALKDAYKITLIMRPILDELFSLEFDALSFINELDIEILSALDKFALLLKFSKRLNIITKQYSFPKHLKRLLSLQINSQQDKTILETQNESILTLKKIRKEDRLFWINYLAIALYCQKQKFFQTEEIKKLRKKLIEFCNSEYVDFNFRASELMAYGLSEQKLNAVMAYTKKMWLSSYENISAKTCKKIAENFIFSSK